MGTEQDSPLNERAKGAAICTDCEDIVSVWVKKDRVEPISTEGVCSCGNPSLRLLNEDGEANEDCR